MEALAFGAALNHFGGAAILCNWENFHNLGRAGEARCEMRAADELIQTGERAMRRGAMVRHATPMLLPQPPQFILRAAPDPRPPLLGNLVQQGDRPLGRGDRVGGAA